MNPPQRPLQVEWVQDGLRTSAGNDSKATTTERKLSYASQRPERAGDLQWRGPGKWTIAWRRDGLRVLLTLPSENYVVAALNGEAAPDEPMASLKAMAISMRTFALLNANRHHAEGFGLCDSTHCQALRLGKARPEVERAVRETAGETLWFGGRRAHVYYTQHCGGMSEPAERRLAGGAGAVTSRGIMPILIACAVPQPSGTHRLRSLELSSNFSGPGLAHALPIEAIRVTRRSAGGRAELLEVTGQGAPARLSASSFRFAVDRALGWNQMRSDWYEASVSGASLEIAGRGYGHGVGLCQAGAYEMAAEGHSETEILRFLLPRRRRRHYARRPRMAASSRARDGRC